MHRPLSKTGIPQNVFYLSGFQDPDDFRHLIRRVVAGLQYAEAHGVVGLGQEVIRGAIRVCEYLLARSEMRIECGKLISAFKHGHAARAGPDRARGESNHQIAGGKRATRGCENHKEDSRQPGCGLAEQMYAGDDQER